MSFAFQRFFPVTDYDLAATLSCGQAFRWETKDDAWEGVIGSRWVRLTERPDGLLAWTTQEPGDWQWLETYLQVGVEFPAILKTFPEEEPMRLAVRHCHGLRLLRQEPWECLASFILSSTKQIVQIRQIVRLLCERFGHSISVPKGHPPVYTFPTVERLARCSESDLRVCKMGFRAPYLLATAQMVTSGQLNLESLYLLPVGEARAALMTLPGVGRKVADCVLLFAYGFQEAFPIDVWVLKALQQLYFPKRKPAMQRLIRFSETHFGPYSGYAQQYLFHYMRTVAAPRKGSHNQVPD